MYGNIITTLKKDSPRDKRRSLLQIFLIPLPHGFLTLANDPQTPRLLTNGPTMLWIKCRKKGRTVYDILLDLYMIKTGKYSEAIEQLKPHRNIDSMICPSISCCYFMLSTRHGAISDTSGPVRAPNAKALSSCEQMIELIRLHPPVHRH